MRIAIAVAAASAWSADPCPAFTPPPPTKGGRAPSTCSANPSSALAPSSSSKRGRTSSTSLASSIAVDDVEQRSAPAIDSETVDEALTIGELRNDEPPALGEIARMLPRETFAVDTRESLLYFAADVTAVVLSMGFLDAVVTSDPYRSWPIAGQALAAAPLQVLVGFAMWCTWCIGHDAGHGTVSKDPKYGKAINRVVGEITHSVVCLTPYVPWALSHRKHHLHHNHLEKDYSHQWYVQEESDDLHPLIMLSYNIRMLFFPFMYFIYLVTGVPDGGHVFFYGRMWEGHSMKERLDASLSVVISFATAGLLWSKMGTADFAVVCMGPWMVMSFWLFMVTYLQHHSEDGKLYTDDTFTFERGAFQTVDRNYGEWVNRLSHHMMDGHVVHHLFFTKVPHYRLEAATKALKKGMEERGQGHLYKEIDTPDYSQEIVRKYFNNWFFVNEDQVVRE